MPNIRIFLLLLALSYLLSLVSAIPATRTHNLNSPDNSALPFSTEVETRELGNGEMKEQVDMEEGFIEMRRMAIETEDYGAGRAEANTDHNPKIPA